MSSHQFQQMPNKTCNTCRLNKSLESFYKKTESRDGRQGQCKDCHKARQRDWVNSSAPSRQKVDEVELSQDQKRQVYSGVLFRMYNSGLLSEKTLKESLERIRGL